MREVRTDTSIGLSEVVVPVSVVYPRVVEEHDGVEHAELSREGARLCDNTHLGHSGVGVFCPLKIQPHTAMSLR